MKKLKNKVFLTLFIIFTIFLLTIIFIFNFQNYNREKNNIISSLSQMNSDKVVKPFDKENEPEKIDEPFDRNKMFMDTTIYTVIIENNEISEIISHTEDETVSDDIRSVAKDIVESSNIKNIYIGNLYSNRYSYKYVDNNKIVIIDNLDTNNKLKSSVRLSIFYFIIGELIAYVISYFLSKRIIKPAEDSLKAQKQFIADASHELKTPLAVIMASSEAMEKDNDKKWLNNIKSESERMNKLIKDLLDLAKMENGNIQKDYNIIDLSKLVEKSILTLESLIYEKNIILNYNIDEDIHFKCNSDEIKQLLAILLDNAIKHSVANGKIIITLTSDDKKIYLKVKNKGLPIPKGDEDKIFERFYRADKSRNRNENRYGLGLAIAKSIVINHNGIISASSSEGYTIFKVVFKK